jgi:hypothetical protein
MTVDILSLPTHFDRESPISLPLSLQGPDS